MEGYTNQLIGHTTFLAGNKKNAGKTTFLNLILNQVRKVTSPAFMTIGIDGEPNDLINNQPKPQICTYPGDVVISSIQMLEKSNAQFEILHIFSAQTPLGRLGAAKTLRSGVLELVGAQDNKQLCKMVDYLKNELGLKTIIIDGAAGRTTQLAAVHHAQYFYIHKVDGETLSVDIEQLKILSLISEFTEIEKIEGNEQHNIFHIKGALTTSRMNEIPSSTKVLMVEDFTKIFLNYYQIKNLADQYKIACIYGFKLLAFVVILKNITQSDFKNLIAPLHLTKPIIFNPYAL